MTPSFKTKFGQKNLHKLRDYNKVSEAEVDGFKLNGTDYIVCYISHSKLAAVLSDMMQQYMLDNPDLSVIFMGDFNIHNKEWLISKVDTDEGRSIAQEFQSVCRLRDKEWQYARFDYLSL